MVELAVVTRELAEPADRVVWGVDPAPAMLDFARRQPEAGRVRWVEGDAAALGECEVDLLIMTGNVAQVFLEDAQWLATLRDVHAALRPGGVLAFEAHQTELTDSLLKTGFEVESVFGDWQRGTLLQRSSVMVFVSRRH